MELTGKVLDQHGDILTIKVDRQEDIREYHSRDVSLILSDSRSITSQQRRFAFAVIADIAKSGKGGYWADRAEDVYIQFKWWYKQIFDDEVSLSKKSGDKESANQFISLLISFALKYDIALSQKPLGELEGDFAKLYEYQCLIEKKCVICGKKAELAHVKSIGYLNSRKQMSHIGIPAMALCHAHHMQQHSDEWGVERFMSEYHIQGVPIDERIVKLYPYATGEK